MKSAARLIYLCFIRITHNRICKCLMNINTCICETYHLFSIQILIYYESFNEVGGDGVQIIMIGISDRTEQNLTLHMCPQPACFFSLHFSVTGI